MYQLVEKSTKSQQIPIISFKFFYLILAVGFSFNRRPEENPWITRDRLTPTSAAEAGPSFITEKGNTVASPEDTDVNNKCIICMENPKNATLIHGDTGHCCSCWACAQVLKQRGDPCPICRAPIEHVIRQFNAWRAVLPWSVSCYISLDVG